MHVAWSLPLDRTLGMVSTSHYPAHVLSSVITITVINTDWVPGYLCLASSTYLLTLKVKCVFCRCVWLRFHRSHVNS